MSFKIPDTLQIAGQTWRIYRKDNAPKRLRPKLARLYARGVYGETHFAEREILLASGLTEEQERVTLCHELLHALYDVSGDQNLGPELEERIIEALDEHLYSVILQLLQFNTTKGNP